MKVICVSHIVHPFQPHKWDENDPQIGDICTVIQVLTGHGVNGFTAQCYKFKEFKPGFCYHVQDFAPLSDLDETIIHADKIKEGSYA